MPRINSEDAILRSVRNLPSGAFSTADFVIEFRNMFPGEWQDLELKYGVGGKGAGQQYTAYTYVAMQLGKLANREELLKIEYRPSPKWWGSPWVQYWSTLVSDTIEGNKIPTDDEYREGSTRLKVHLFKERAWGLSAKKKAAFLEVFGKLSCERCGFDPADVYGIEHGNSVIEVHHAATSVSNMTENHRTRLDDLQCLCANCHRFTHAKMG